MIFKERSTLYNLSTDFAQSVDLAADGFTPGQRQKWWSPKIDRKTLKSLYSRQDKIPLINYLLWITLLIVSGVAAYSSLATWWCAIPAFFVYGTIYSSCDPRSHDLGHGATFKTKWVNDFFLHLTRFMTLKEPIDWRWRHTRHHTDTLHVGRDPEIFVARPADLIRIFADFFFLVQAYNEIKGPLLRTFGYVTGDSEHYVPRTEHKKTLMWSRFSRFLRISPYDRPIPISVGSPVLCELAKFLRNFVTARRTS